MPRQVGLRDGVPVRTGGGGTAGGSPISEKMEHARQVVAVHMDHILTTFKPGCKIAVLVRTPGHPDRDFVMTNDETTELIAMLQRRQTDPHTIEIPPDKPSGWPSPEDWWP